MLRGVENFRDLGGLPLKIGGVTRSGVLWRSGHLDGVDDAAWSWATPEFFVWSRDRWPQRWSAALTDIADAPGGVLMHCAAGRDRTGITTAIILETAGVEREAILDDYVRGIRESSDRRVPVRTLEYRDALNRLLDRLDPEPELVRAARRLH